MSPAAERDQPVEFGHELRRYRQATGRSLRALAQRIVFDFSYLAQVERGERHGSLDLARRCDQVLGAKGHLVQAFGNSLPSAIREQGRR